VDAVVGPVDGDERLAEITQGGFAGSSDVLFAHQDPHRPIFFHPREDLGATSVAACAPFGLLGQLDLGDQAAGRRIPPGELDAGRFPDQTATSIAPDQIPRPQR
jgi:hypothetical protein